MASSLEKSSLLIVGFAVWYMLSFVCSLLELIVVVVDVMWSLLFVVVCFFFTLMSYTRVGNCCSLLCWCDLFVDVYCYHCCRLLLMLLLVYFVVVMCCVLLLFVHVVVTSSWCSLVMCNCCFVLLLVLFVVYC